MIKSIFKLILIFVSFKIICGNKIIQNDNNEAKIIDKYLNSKRTKSFTKIPGHHIAGGTYRVLIRDALKCKNECMKDSKCIAADFNNRYSACYLHYQTDGWLEKDSDSDHYKKTAYNKVDAIASSSLEATLATTARIITTASTITTTLMDMCASQFIGFSRQDGYCFKLLGMDTYEYSQLNCQLSGGNCFLVSINSDFKEYAVENYLAKQSATSLFVVAAGTTNLNEWNWFTATAIVPIVYWKNNAPLPYAVNKILAIYNNTWVSVDYLTTSAYYALCECTL